MEKYTDEMLKKYLTWVKTLDENDINLDHYHDFLSCSAYNKLIKPFGSDDNDVSEFVYALIYENLGPPFSKEFVRPQLNSYTIEHRNHVNIRRIEYWEGNIETYLPESSVDNDYIYDLESNGYYNWWDGEMTDSEEYDSDTTESEVYDINKD